MTKQLTDRLIAEFVKNDATDFSIRDGRLFMKRHYSDNQIWINHIFLPPGQWRIVGEVTDGVPDFDPKPYVQKVIIRTEVPTRATGYLDTTCYRNYLKPEDKQFKYAFEDHKESFTTLLTSHSCHTGKWIIIEKVNS